MPVSPAQLAAELSTVVDPSLAGSIIQCYVEMQQRFLAGDWKPTELDAGCLCEAVSRGLLQVDQGMVDHSKGVSDIRQILQNKNIPHNLNDKDLIHATKVIEAVYKVRSDRGPVHLSQIHAANAIDSMLVVHAGKWMLAELLRLALKRDLKVVAEQISQLAQLEHAIIHELDGKPLVLPTDISAPDEILILINHASNNRLGRSDLISQAVHQSPANISVACSRLAKQNLIRKTENGEYAITPPGINRVMNEILPKYTPKV